MLTEIISALAQVLVFSLIPFIWYVIKHRKVKGFFEWIGLKRSTLKGNLMSLLVVAILAGPILILVFLNDDFEAIMTDPKSITGKVKAMGFGMEAILTILVISLIKTSLAEEIFFRGFLAKRLIAWTNYQVGNILQAFIFGIIHTLLFLSITHNPLFLTVIFIFPATGAYFKTYINEKLANGSIIPGWIAHGVGNLIAYSVVAFGI